MNRLSSMFDLSPSAMAALNERYGLADMPAPAPPASIGPPPPPAYDPSVAHSPAPPGTVGALGGGPGGALPIPNDFADPSQSAGPAPKTMANGPLGFASMPPVDPSMVPGSPPPAKQVPVAPASAGPVGMWMPGPQSISTQSTQYNPDLLAQSKRYGDEQADAANLRMMTEGAMNQQDAIALGAKATAKAYADDVYQGKREELQARRNAYTNEQIAKLRQISTEMQQGVDPQAFFKERGTLATIGMAIAQGVGQFAAMMTGTENTAARIIEQGIERNIRAQQQNLQNKRARFDVESNLLAANTEAFGSEEAGLAATRMHYLNAVNSMVDAKLAEERGPLQTKLDGAKLKENLAAMYKQQADKFLDATKVNVATQESQHYGMVGGAGSSTKPLENTATLSDGTTVQFQNSEQGNKAVERFQAHAKVQTLYSMAKEKRAALQKMSPGTPEYEAERNALQKMATDIIYEESMARGQGVVKKEEMEEGLKTSPIMRGVGGAGYIRGYLSKLDPTIDRDFKAGAQGIDSAIKQSEEEQRAIAKAAGARLIQRGYATDAAGRPTPTGQYTGQDLQPDQRLAPSGFKPLDSRIRMPTAGKPLSETTPMAPRVKK